MLWWTPRERNEVRRLEPTVGLSTIESFVKIFEKFQRPQKYYKPEIKRKSSILKKRLLSNFETTRSTTEESWGNNLFWMLQKRFGIRDFFLKMASQKVVWERWANKH